MTQQPSRRHRRLRHSARRSQRPHPRQLAPSPVPPQPARRTSTQTRRKTDRRSRRRRSADTRPTPPSETDSQLPVHPDPTGRQWADADLRMSAHSVSRTFRRKRTRRGPRGRWRQGSCPQGVTRRSPCSSFHGRQGSRCQATPTPTQLRSGRRPRSETASHVVVSRIPLTALGQPIPSATHLARQDRSEQASPQRRLLSGHFLFVSLGEITDPRTSSVGHTPDRTAIRSARTPLSRRRPRCEHVSIHRSTDATKQT